MGDFDGLRDAGLILGLGFSSSTAKLSESSDHTKLATDLPRSDEPTKLVTDLPSSDEPSLTLSLPGEIFQTYQSAVKRVDSGSNYNQSGDYDHDLHRKDSADSRSSDFSNVSVNVKREREAEIEDAGVDDGSNAGIRKKLRLTKVQSALLEESFKLQSTLNPRQKQELARELKLRPRQVEVWFQNRRARTKLKQTEVDCEFLKKCCDTLTNENRRLQKELKELKTAAASQPFYMQLPEATLTMCPSCEKIADGGGAENASKTSFSLTPKPHHFFNPFTNPSAAC